MIRCPLSAASLPLAMPNRTIADGQELTYAASGPMAVQDWKQAVDFDAPGATSAIA